MKKVILLFLAAGVFLSCQNNAKYKIKGTVADVAYEGTNVYLQKMADDTMIITDSGIVQNGKFSFSGIVDVQELRFIILDESVDPQKASGIPILVEPGKLDVRFDSVIIVKGTKINSAYTDYRLKQNILRKEIESLIEQYNSTRAAGEMTDSLEAEINKAYDNIEGQLADLTFTIIKDNIKNELGEYIFLNSSSMFEPEQQKEILSLADDDFKGKEKIKKIMKHLENVENVAVGKKFVDFTLKSSSGDDVSLSDYAGKGKYVLVDFWASWCGPCRNEMPNVVAAYDKYKEKGFEVIGVSFDKNHADWIQGIKDLNMTWPQMSDLQYWDSPLVDMYAINGIPHTVLLDKEGIIIEKNLRGNELFDKLAELMP